MAGSGEHFKALVRSHGSGDDEAFYSVALQVAAQAARQGHHHLAADLKAAVDHSRVERPKKVTSIAQPRGDLSELVIASHPAVGLKDLVLPDEPGRAGATCPQRTAPTQAGFWITALSLRIASCSRGRLVRARR